MLSQQEINEQLQLLAIYRRMLVVYVQQQDAIGKAFSPPALAHGIDDARGNIRRIKALLGADGIEISEDPDDEESPLPRAGALGSARRSFATVLAIAGGAALLAVTGMVLGFFGQSFIQHRRTQGGPTVPPQATVAPTRASTTSMFMRGGGAQFFEYTFTDGSIGGWSGAPENWQLVQDGDSFVYQGLARNSPTTATPPNPAALRELQNYAVETRVRVVRPGLTTDDLADVWLTLRAQDSSHVGWRAYSFSLINMAGNVSIARDGSGGDQYHWTQLSAGQVAIEPGVWYDIRAEVAGSRLKLFVDGELALEASDTELTQGSFFVTVGPGAMAQFAYLHVYQL